MEHRNKACQDFSTASAFPAKAAPSRSIPARILDRPASPRRSGPAMRQQPPGSPTSPSGIVARNPQTRPSLPGICKRQSSARIASRPAACPQPTYQRALPTVSSSQEGPFPHFQRYASGPEASTREKKTPASSLPSFPPPSPRPHDQTCPFLPAASQRRGPAARPEESFFGDGESTRGEGAVFTKNAPSPLVIPLLHGLSPTKKAGQWPAPAFTGKTKER